MSNRRHGAALACALFLLLGAAGPALAQDGVWLGAAVGGGYRIGKVSFEIEGRTRWYYARQAADIEEGKLFPDRPSLEVYLADRTQLLLNKRTIETASIEPVFGEAGADGVVPVDLVVRLKDTVNVIVLPYFKYDSNDGLLLSARGRNYNFLGTMQPLRVDLNYTVDEDGDQEFELEAELDLPFRMAERDFVWGLDQSLSYNAEAGLFSYDLSTGVDVKLPLFGGDLVFGPSQSLSINPSDDDYEDDIYRGWFLKSRLGGSYKIPLPLDLGYFGPLYGKLGAEAYHYWRPGEEVPADWSGPVLAFSQSLSFGRVDWIGNLRQGLEASAGTTESYNFDDVAWTSKISGSVDGHYRFGPSLGASGRLMAFHTFNDTDDEAGEALRGILDDRVDTDTALYLNLELPFRVYHYMPHEWTGVDWLQYIALEQYWSPFFDMALTHDKATGTWFDPKEGWYALGLEVITYPHKFRSFYIRVSAGFEVWPLVKTKSISGRSTRDDEMGREIYIGLGHHF
ncbi:MAG TPA: hypothetical protein PLB91_02405 [Spirochaetales bacterium]|nr:hypothetical protein [Spirochaetales bacterium]HRY53137.1 hypothetical protein [Spirochaetia bacterium]